MPHKKILILSSHGGYGHIAAANTLKALLGTQYEIETIYPIPRIFKIPAAEAIFYNLPLSYNLNRLINWIVRHITGPFFHVREKSAALLIEQEIERTKPDILISLIPFVNYPASEAARKCGIPFLIITTDNDLQNWCQSLSKRTYQNFRVTIGSNLPTSKNALIQQHVSEDLIETTGLPLRPDFLKIASKEDLRKKYKIPLNKEVVLIMMGGMGGRATLQYVKTILQQSLGIHLIVCAGKNQKLVKKLGKISCRNNNSLEIVPFTEKVHELFAISDLVVTKPGPGTVNEASALRIPILIDQTGTPLAWEKVNIEIIQQQKIGAAVRSLKELPSLIHRFLRDEQTREEVSRAYKTLPKNQFAEKIQPLIEELIGIPSQGEVLLTSRSLTPPL